MSTHLFSLWLFLIPTILVANQTWQGSCIVLYPLLSAHGIFDGNNQEVSVYLVFAL